MNGPVSWLGYAFRFLQLPLGLFGVAVASASLPEISRNAAVGKMEDFHATLTRSLNMILLLTIPSAAGLAVLGKSMVAVVYQWGRFTAEDTHQTALALGAYSVGLAGYASGKILAPAFYALGDARTPMWVSAASIAVNPICAVALSRWARMGHTGLALSTSLVALFGAGLLFVSLRSRTGWKDPVLVENALKITAAAAIMAAACWISSRLILAAAGTGKPAELATVAISIPLGAAVFLAAARKFGVSEAELAWHACYNFLRRNAPRYQSGDSSPGNR